MSFYTIQEGTESQRNQLRKYLFGVDQLTKENQEKVITAWMTSWLNSTYETLEEMVYSTMAPSYRLMDHVGEVTRFGITFAKSAIEQWGTQTDFEELIQILILHDVDKPFLYIKKGERAEKSELAHQIQHGVLGALILHDLGFTPKIVSTVATHATNSPFHGSTFEAFVLHYADLFSADHAIMLDGTQPFYQKHWL